MVDKIKDFKSGFHEKRLEELNKQSIFVKQVKLQGFSSSVIKYKQFLVIKLKMRKCLCACVTCHSVQNFTPLWGNLNKVLSLFTSRSPFCTRLYTLFTLHLFCHLTAYKSPLCPLPGFSIHSRVPRGTGRVLLSRTGD